MADGRGNTGNFNTGNRNTGDHNTGDHNTGDYNTGYCNTGDYNTGYCNTGYCNTGDHNTGGYNTGDYNAGDYNTGAFNSSNFSNGVFCTVEPKIPIFNMQSDMTATEFYNSKWWRAIESSTFSLKEVHGATRLEEYKVACQKWWEGLTEEDKEIIKSLPNFNNEIFEEITGIKLGRKIRFYVENDISEIKYFDGKPTDEEINRELIQWLTEKDGYSIGWEEVE